MGNRRNSAL